ncbi:hypothetical protein HQQ80_00405 [Microbacteriaceae bacterium VKM Ac-2855]|nr:hypothetical protein [Microbacteriaceae bacterium VKM Ac-2855]
MTASARRRTTRTGLHLAALVVLAASMAGCTPSAPGPTDGSVAPSATQSVATPTPTPDPVLVPGGSAEQNKAFFDATNAAVIAGSADANGRSFIDALSGAGFDKSAMEVTADATSIGLAADSVQFSVTIGQDCLIGQYGPKSGGYHSIIAKPIATGACLVGQTVAIDW